MADKVFWQINEDSLFSILTYVYMYVHTYIRMCMWVVLLMSPFDNCTYCTYSRCKNLALSWVCMQHTSALRTARWHSTCAVVATLLSTRYSLHLVRSWTAALGPCRWARLGQHLYASEGRPQVWRWRRDSTVWQHGPYHRWWAGGGHCHMQSTQHPALVHWGFECLVS